MCLRRLPRDLRGSYGRSLRRDDARVKLPDGLDREHPGASTSWLWQWVFPASRPYVDQQGAEP